MSCRASGALEYAHIIALEAFRVCRASVEVDKIFLKVVRWKTLFINWNSLSRHQTCKISLLKLQFSTDDGVAIEQSRKTCLGLPSTVSTTILRTCLAGIHGRLHTLQSLSCFTLCRPKPCSVDVENANLVQNASGLIKVKQRSIQTVEHTNKTIQNHNGSFTNPSSTQRKSSPSRTKKDELL